MKKIILITTEKALEIFSAFLEENFIASYNASNSAEAYYKNFINYPDLITEIQEDVVLFIANDIDNISEQMWFDTIQDMKNKNATFNTIIMDTKVGEIREYKNKSGNINIPIIDMETFEKLKTIDDIVERELSISDEFER